MCHKRCVYSERHKTWHILPHKQNTLSSRLFPVVRLLMFVSAWHH